MTQILEFNQSSFYETTAIQALDPLLLDGSVVSIQQANAHGDKRFLTQLLVQLSSSLANLELGSEAAALAAMRDVGIVLGSLKRHGLEPISAVPQIEPLLAQLGEFCAMVPRDTVLHYTSWNPDGPRRRAYTDDAQERLLQAAVVKVFPSLSASLCISEWLRDIGPQDARCAPLVDSLHDLATVMVDSIDGVVKDVSPVFFARTLRPYFEDINIRGRAYLGPAAAQAPLWLIDLCIWASDRSSEGYRGFLDASVPYCLPSWRSYYEQLGTRESLVSRLRRCLENPEAAQDHNVLRSAASVARLLRMLKTFRGRHLGLARKAYAPEVRLYDEGSGGAPIALLQEILDLTLQIERFVLNKPSSAHSPATGEAEAPR
ncbi:monodechloroaminopyrrolnitrin synthase PrnB family protein [Variovorax ginsengisoli]|uniref:DUF1864 family protein n=1 Tax=Variovorax ginsengisoli TaxID=363844 RepID=A0ABT8SEA0_9BURK|nr:monodechloroaminopyrrolnitrin synthase PrnB family protein [Variovorax ginsengisoli]MDN8617322.1 DUF1864 family protein [Variovorax ginsengisoli]MDO1536492.1 DUF1864 family protein [Variovorax ginsengisoli]